MKTTAWRLAVFVCLGSLGCDATPPADDPPDTQATTGDDVATTTTDAADSTGTTSQGGDDSSDASSGATSTGAPAPYEAPEQCSRRDDCTHSCYGDRPLDYWRGCPGTLCIVDIEPADEDVRCAIEALRDETPGTIVIRLEEAPDDWEEGFTQEHAYLRIAPSGLVARGLEQEQYDTKVGGSYETTLYPLARAQPEDHPAWETCLEPSPDLSCILGSSALFAEECVDEAFEPCA